MGRLELISQLSPEEMIHHAEEVLEGMGAGVAEVSELLEAAERDGRILHIRCLSDQLETLRALHAVTQIADAALKQALATGSEDLAQHEHRKLSIARARFQQTMHKAAACLRDSTESGKTEVEVVGTSISGPDETEAPELDDGGCHDPPEISQFQ